MATGLENVDPDLCRERVAGGHHAVGRDDLRPTRMRATRGPSVAVAERLALLVRTRALPPGHRARRHDADHEHQRSEHDTAMRLLEHGNSFHSNPHIVV